MAELKWGAASHEGQLRSQNEDNFHAGDGLFVVADGMGGHLAGEVASEMAVTRLRENLDGDDTATLDELVAAIDQANGEIFDGSMARADQAGMGTTITTIAVVADDYDGQAFGIANVGDSRCYVLRHSRLRQLTIDHSFVQELVAEGAITRDEARTHPRRNIVTRALGIEPSVRIDSWTMPIFQDDRLLLCSDGLVDEITDAEITAILVDHDDPGDAAQALVDAANAAGGRDNVTVVVVDVLEGDAPPDPTEEFDVVPLWADEGENTGETQIIADPLPEDEEDDADGEDDEDTEANGDVDADTGDIDGDESEGDSGDTEPATDVAPVLPARTPTDAPAPKRSRAAGLIRFLLVVGFAAVLVLGFAIMAAWARSGYFVAFDDQDRVVIYQGREVLWFDPTVEAYGQYSRDELDQDSVNLVEEQRQFQSQDSAARFVAERLTPLPPPAADGATTATTDTSTPTTDASNPATATPAPPTTAGGG